MDFHPVCGSQCTLVTENASKISSFSNFLHNLLNTDNNKIWVRWVNEAQKVNIFITLKYFHQQLFQNGTAVLWMHVGTKKAWLPAAGFQRVNTKLGNTLLFHGVIEKVSVLQYQNQELLPDTGNNIIIILFR